MKSSKKAHFRQYLYDLEVKQAGEKLEVLPLSCEKYTLQNTHLFGTVTEFEEHFNDRINKIYFLLQEMDGMIHVSSDVFETLPNPKKIKIQAMSGKINKIRELLFDASDCHFLVKNDYENKVREAFYSLLKTFE
jgi:hypothetical protein